MFIYEGWKRKHALLKSCIDRRRLVEGVPEVVEAKAKLKDALPDGWLSGKIAMAGSVMKDNVDEAVNQAASRLLGFPIHRSPSSPISVLRNDLRVARYLASPHELHAREQEKASIGLKPIFYVALKPEVRDHLRIPLGPARLRAAISNARISD